MFVEMAIADAYGACFEFQPQKFIDRYNTGEKYIQHKSGRIEAGRYTDDTQMAIALGELISEERPFTRLALAEKFLEVFKRDVRPGYAGGFYNFLVNTESPDDFLKNILPNSTKSGAAMRAVPLGLFSNIDEVIANNYLQASITHNTEEGISSSVAVALSAYFFDKKLGYKKELPAFLSQYIQGDWLTPWAGFVSVEGLDCTKAALTAIQETNTLQDLLIKSVSFSGDTDTVACIAVGIASLSEEFANNLPQTLYQGLENGKYGLDFLHKIDNLLLKKTVFLP